jgi:hypothetical protein
MADTNPARALNVVKRAVEMCDFIEHPAIRQAVEQEMVPVTMQRTVEALVDISSGSGSGRSAFGLPLMRSRKERVSGWRLWRLVDDPYLIAEVTRHPGEHSRVGGNTSSLLQRKIESVEDYPLWHWDRGPKMPSSYETGSSDLQAR